MQQGQIIFTGMERVIFGQPAAETLLEEVKRLGAKRVFLLVSNTLNKKTNEVEKVKHSLGDFVCGLYDQMPAHSPRNAVVECAEAARSARADLVVTFGGGSVTDGGKAVCICLKHNVRDIDGLEPFRTIVDKYGNRSFPDYEAPDIQQIAIPTTLSGGEFNARAGITDPRIRLKQSFIHPKIIPTTVILDPMTTIHTPSWLFFSTGVRAIDHAVETYLSIDANDYTDGAALQALRLLADGLQRVKSDQTDLDARLKCLIGTWLSMVGIVTGTRLGASHAIGHILGGSAGVPHGYTSCIMLPSVLEWNAEENESRQMEITKVLGNGSDTATSALDRLITNLEMPRRLSDMGILEAQLGQLAKNCMLDDWTFSNPREIKTPEQVMEILKLAF